jgi:hypothetical protein
MGTGSGQSAACRDAEEFHGCVTRRGPDLEFSESTPPRRTDAIRPAKVFGGRLNRPSIRQVVDR